MGPIFEIDFIAGLLRLALLRLGRLLRHDLMIRDNWKNGRHRRRCFY
jgi:hypothetical protein